MEIFTTSFAKLSKHKKDEDRDIYISVMRSASGQARFNPSVYNNLDLELEIFGNYSENLEDYISDLEDLYKKGLKEGINIFEPFEEILSDEDYQDEEGREEYNKYRVFLICIENIDKKPCHRTMLAKYLSDRYNINITEWR